MSPPPVTGSKKGKKEWKPVVESTMPWWKKTLIAAGLAFFPFLLGVILPIVTRNHIIKNMKIGEDLVNNPPEEFNLVSTAEPASSYQVICRGVGFNIPRTMVPVRVNPESVIFRRSPRPIARTLAFTRQKFPPPVNTASLGLLRFFIAEEGRTYLEDALYATWHPIRLMCKANLISSQGITSRIFKTQFDDDHTAYVFPTKGNSGYIGRIFSQRGTGYTEMAYFDETTAVTLRDWTNIAKEVDFAPVTGGAEAEKLQGPALAEFVEQAKLGKMFDHVIIETALNQYFATGSESWIIPLAYVMGRQGYLRELIEMQREAVGSIKDDPGLRAHWNQILEETLQTILQIEVDPHLTQNLLVMTCANKGRFALRQLVLRLTLVYPDGVEKQFKQTLFLQGTLQAGSANNLEFPPPEGFSVRGVKAIHVAVDEVEVVD